MLKKEDKEEPWEGQKLVCAFRNFEELLGDDLREENFDKLKKLCEETKKRYAVDLFNTDENSNIDNGDKLLSHYKDEFDEGYDIYKNFLEKKTETFSVKDVKYLARTVCMLQEYRPYDTLEFVGNFFKLIADDNYFIPGKEDTNTFSCKVFRDKGKRELFNLCGLGNGKSVRGSARGKGDKRRLLSQKAADEEEDKEEPKEGECKTKFIILDKNGNGFGVSNEKLELKSVSISDERRITLENVPKVVTIQPSNGLNTNFQVKLDCGKEGKTEKELQVCQCESKISLPILVQGERNGNCVYKLGPSWEIRKCGNRRRRLLYKSGTGC